MDSTHSFMVFSFHDSLADLMPYFRAAKYNLDRDILPFAKPVMMMDGRLRFPRSMRPFRNRSYFEEAGVAPLRVSK